MEVKKTMMAAMLFSGSLAMSPGLLSAQEIMSPGDHSRRESMEDKSSRSPAMPGATKDELQNMSEKDRLELEATLAANGYDPGPVDGIIDNQTRAAIQDFQEDHQLVATGIIDPRTGELLGVVIFQSS